MTHDFHLNVNLNVNILIENAYAQHECAHDSFKKKHEPAYNELTNAIKASAHDQLTPQQFQEWNQPTTFQCLIKRLRNNTREWRRQQRKRQQQKDNQHQPGTTTSNSSTISNECIIECATASKTYNKICYIRPASQNLQQPVRSQWHWRYTT
jgi:hypothetical protein